MGGRGDGGKELMQAVEVNGTRLAYEERGSGAALIFVHGSIEDYRSWLPQMDVFAARYRVIAYSRRYHYPNAEAPGDRRDYTAARHAVDLAALIRGLGLGPAHLVTSSYGGYVALVLAATEPGLVRSLVLGEPPLLPWLGQTAEGAALAAAFDANAWQPAQQALAAGQLEEGVRLFLNGVMGRAAFERMPAASRVMPLDNAAELACEARSPDFFSPFTCADAGRITCPALLLDGERSPRMFYIISEALAGCLTAAERAVIPGTAHAMHLGNPAAYNATVLAFLERH